MQRHLLTQTQIQCKNILLHIFCFGFPCFCFIWMVTFKIHYNFCKSLGSWQISYYFVSFKEIGWTFLNYWETLDRCKGLQLLYVVLPSSTSTRITAKGNKLVINKPTWPGVRMSLSVWRTLYYGPSNDVVVSLRRVAKDFYSPLQILPGLICVTNIIWMK